MFYMFILMSSGWYGKKIRAIKTADTEAFIANGEVVVFTDDIENFTDTMKIEESEIIW